MELRNELLTISNENEEPNTEILDKLVETGNIYMIKKILYSRSYLERKLCTETINNNVKAVNILLDAGFKADINDNFLIHMSFRIGSKEMLKLVLKKMESAYKYETIADIINKYDYLANAVQIL